MADPARAAKMADRIKVVIAQALERRVKDPRLGFVTITDARVTNDLQHATVYYTVFGDAEQQEGTRRALESAKGVLRSEVGRNITARLTPTLAFVPDEIPVNAGHLEELLRVAKEKDAEVAALAHGATFAGDADPYRRDEVDELDDEEDLEDDDFEDAEVDDAEDSGDVQSDGDEVPSDGDDAQSDGDDAEGRR